MEGSWESLWAGRTVRDRTWGLGKESPLKGRGRAGTPCPCWVVQAPRTVHFSPQALASNPPSPGVTAGHSEAPGHFPGVGGVTPNKSNIGSRSSLSSVLAHNSFPLNLSHRVFSGEGSPGLGLPEPRGGGEAAFEIVEAVQSDQSRLHPSEALDTHFYVRPGGEGDRALTSSI